MVLALDCGLSAREEEDARPNLELRDCNSGMAVWKTVLHTWFGRMANRLNVRNPSFGDLVLSMSSSSSSDDSMPSDCMRLHDSSWLATGGACPSVITGRKACSICAEGRV